MSRKKERAISELGDALRRYQAAVDDYDRLFAQALGINPTDARCLEVLTFDFPAGATPAELGSALALTSGSVTTMVDRLVRAGYAERVPHPADGRMTTVLQTEASKGALWELRRSLIERGATFLGGYSVTDLTAITGFLDKVTAIQREEETALRARAGGGNVEPRG